MTFFPSVGAKHPSVWLHSGSLTVPFHKLRQNPWWGAGSWGRRRGIFPPGKWPPACSCRCLSCQTPHSKPAHDIRENTTVCQRHLSQAAAPRWSCSNGLHEHWQLHTHSLRETTVIMNSTEFFVWMTCGWTVASVPLSGFKFSLMDAGKLVSALSPHLSLFLSPLCAGLTTSETMFIQTTGSKLEDKVFVFFTDFPVTFAFSFLFKVDSHFFPRSHTDWESFMTDQRTARVDLTPFLMLVSHRTDMLRRSKSLMSPLSYPAHTQRSCSLKAWPVMKKPKEVQRSLYEIRKRPHWEYNQNASKIWHKNYINIIILN